jgi:hypothetical protein
VSAGFPGERREDHMRKLRRSSDRVTCGSCRRFDGLAWCRRWNFHTTADSPICGQYRPALRDVPLAQQEEAEEHEGHQVGE